MLQVDMRGGSIDIFDHIPSRYPKMTCYLDSGDFRWTGNGPRGRVSVGVEIKHLQDFLGSMRSGRFPGKQLLNMHDEYDYVFLVIQDTIASDQYGNLVYWKPKLDDGKHARREGLRYDERYYYNMKHGYWAKALIGARTCIAYEDFFGWLMTVWIFARMMPLFTGSNQDAGRLVGAMYRWWRKPWDQHKSLKVFDDSQVLESVRVQDGESGQELLLRPTVPAKGIRAAVHGIGWACAMAAADHFGTLRAAFNADTKEWMQVDGIGKELATRAVKAATTVHAYRTPSGRIDDTRKRGGRR